MPFINSIKIGVTDLPATKYGTTIRGHNNTGGGMQGIDKRQNFENKLNNFFLHLSRSDFEVTLATKPFSIRI